jgi:hypothetical protein
MKRFFLRRSKGESAAPPPNWRTDKHNKEPIENVPFEIFEKILGYLVDGRGCNEITRDLRSVAQACKSFYDVLGNEILYERAVLCKKRQALKFYRAICKGPKAACVKFLTIYHPVVEEQQEVGHFYSLSTTSPDTHKTWPEIILDIVSKLPNLESLALDNISPKFEFPQSLAVKSSRASSNVKNMYISCESGWHMNVSSRLLWPFRHLERIVLHGMTLALSTSATLNGLSPEIKDLVLSHCTVYHGGLNSPYFARVTALSTDEYTMEHTDGILNLPSACTVRLGLLPPAAKLPRARNFRIQLDLLYNPGPVTCPEWRCDQDARISSLHVALSHLPSSVAHVVVANVVSLQKLSTLADTGIPQWTFLTLDRDKKSLLPSINILSPNVAVAVYNFNGSLVYSSNSDAPSKTSNVILRVPMIFP